MARKTSNTAPSRTDILRAIKRVGHSGAYFHSRDIREDLGVKPADRNGSVRIYNAVKSFERDGIIAEVPGTRKRNKYYRIADEEKLREQISWRSSSANGESRPTGTPVGSLTRIESALRSLEERFDRFDSKLSELMAIWS